MCVKREINHSLCLYAFSEKQPLSILLVAHQMLVLLKGIDNDKLVLDKRFMVRGNFIDLGLAVLLEVQYYFQQINCI